MANHPPIPPNCDRFHSVSTIRKEGSFLRRVFQRALESGRLAVNPWRAIRLPAEPKRPPKFLTRDEFDRLVKAAPEHRAFRYWLLVATGARREEALRLKWGDVGKDAVRIENARKGAGPRYPVRVVPMTKDLAKLVRKNRGKDDEAVFCSKNNWLRDMREDMKKAGVSLEKTREVKNILRHTFCSWLAQAGVSLHRIRDLAGHTSITTTEQYAHLCQTADQEVAKVFGPQRVPAKKKREVA